MLYHLTTDIYQYRYVPIECKYSALNNAELENISMKRKVELQCFKSMSKLKYSKSEFGEKIWLKFYLWLSVDI